MAIGTVVIHKISECGDIGCYEISSDSFKINNFYMCINKSKEIVKFFLTKDFAEHPVRIIDFNKKKPIGSIPGMPTKVFTIALRRILEVFQMDTFPDSLTYSA